jgi:hypothetical protein
MDNALKEDAKKQNLESDHMIGRYEKLNATLLRPRDKTMRVNAALEKKLTAVSNALSKAKPEVRASQA